MGPPASRACCTTQQQEQQQQHSGSSIRVVLFAYLRRCRLPSASCGTAPSGSDTERNQKQRTKRGRGMKKINNVLAGSLSLLLPLLRICNCEGSICTQQPVTPSKGQRPRVPARAGRRTSECPGACYPLAQARRVPFELFTVYIRRGADSREACIWCTLHELGRQKMKEQSEGAAERYPGMHVWPRTFRLFSMIAWVGRPCFGAQVVAALDLFPF